MFPVHILPHSARGISGAGVWKITSGPAATGNPIIHDLQNFTNISMLYLGISAVGEGCLSKQKIRSYHIPQGQIRRKCGAFQLQV